MISSSPSKPITVSSDSTVGTFSREEVEEGDKKERDEDLFVAFPKTKTEDFD